MSIKPEIKKFETVKSFNFTAKNAVECRVNIKEDETAYEIYTNGRVILYFIECEKNQVRYGGKVIFSTILGGENIKSVEAGVEFSYKTDLEGVDSGDFVTASPWVENVKLSVVNGIPTVSCAVVISGKVEKVIECDYVRSLDNLICKKAETTTSALIYKEDKTFTVEEEFDVSMVVEEVLSHTERVKVQGVLCGIGAVSVSGEIELGVIALGSDKTPYSFTQVIPFRLEHEIQKAMPDLIAISNVNLKDSNLKIVVDKNKDKSAVFLRADLSIISKLYENRPTAYLVDAYSLSKEIAFEKTSNEIFKTDGQKCIDGSVKDYNVAKSQENSRLVAPLFVKIEQTDVKVVDSDVEISLVLETDMLMQGDNGYFIQTSIIPYTLKGDSDFSNIEVLSSTAYNLTAVDKGSLVSLSLDLSVCVQQFTKSVQSFIVSVEEGEDKKVNDSAISVYFPSRGDSLWEVSKTLGVSEEDILKVNPDLDFPLSGDERIVVYREIKND